MLKMLTRLKGGAVHRSLERATRDPQRAQTALLLEILAANRNSQYGRAHSFHTITDAATFAGAVPVCTYADLAPCVEKMKEGKADILTAGRPLAFNVTSGTTDEPKFLPVTRRGLAAAADLSALWLYRALQDHPRLLNGALLCVAGVAVEGRTRAGTPYGSASGVIRTSLPRVLRRSLVLPMDLCGIKDYELRYRLTARLAVERDVSFAATPSPATLTRIAEAAIRHQEDIVRSVHDGVATGRPAARVGSRAARILKSIDARVKPNRSRARFLERVIDLHGRLLPAACWPRLRLIGCWLGGSIGFLAGRLSEYYGQTVPRRDLGYLASEGSMAVPCEDGTPSGIPALRSCYFEFVPAGEEATPEARTLGCHELEQGAQYKVLLTNWNGLYRYDIDDVVEVTGFHNKTPMIAFVRKGPDMVNIMGEKVHVNHLLEALRVLREAHGVRVRQCRALPNCEASRHELLVVIDSDLPKALLHHTVLPAIDRSLSESNMEYEAKRESGRLMPPCIHVMGPGWEEEVRRHWRRTGGRDIQGKWRMVVSGMSEADRKHIQCTVEM